MKRTLLSLMVCTAILAHATLVRANAAEPSGTPTEAENAALATWKSLLKDAPDSTTWTTDAGRRAFMKLMRQYMPRFKGPHGGGPGRRGPRPNGPTGTPPTDGPDEQSDSTH